MLNRIQLIGNVGKEVEVFAFDNGTKKASFTLATSETYKNKDGERVANTEWHNVVCWKNLAEIAEKFIIKGQQLYIEGKINTRSYEDKDNNKRYVTEINASNIIMLGRKSDTKESIPNTSDENHTPPTTDDLPF